MNQSADKINSLDMLSRHFNAAYDELALAMGAPVNSMSLHEAGIFTFPLSQFRE